MKIWQAIYLFGALYGIGGNWRQIARHLRDNFFGTVFAGILLALLWIPGSILLAYAVDWIRGIRIPPPP